MVAITSSAQRRRSSDTTEERAGARGIRRVLTAASTALLLVTLAACSSGAPASSAGAGGTPADTAAAEEFIAPYVGQASPFPVDEPLSAPLPAGTEIVYLQCGTPVCGLVHDMLRGAVETAGATFTAINAGSTASTSQTAAASALALDPDAVIITGVDPSQFGDSLKALSDAGVKVVSISVARDTDPFGITFNYQGAEFTELAGQLLANWVIAREGDDADAVYYNVPAIDYSPVMQAAFEEEMAKNCPSCTVRAVDIDIATLGTTAPQTVVTDLQSHPDTNTAVFGSYEIARGLPAALKAANLDITTTGFAPQPGNLEDIKNGDLTGALAVDFPVAAWTAVDATARLILGDEPTAAELAGVPPIQLLEQDDITFDVSHGFNAYPDFVERFTALWHP